MNIEKMVEDGFEEFWKDQGFGTLHKESFAAGVRHALRSLFPVVRVEDLQPGKSYFFGKGQGWSILDEFSAFGVIGGVEYISDMHSMRLYSDEAIFRGPIPSPADLGLGVGE